MFDQKPGAAPGNPGSADPENNHPTPPPMPAGGDNKPEQAQGVEDIFSPIASEDIPEKQPSGEMGQMGAGPSVPPVPGMGGGDLKASSFKNRKPVKRGGNKILIFVLIFILVSAIVAAAWYYLMYLPGQENVANISNQNTNVNNNSSVVNDNSNENTNTAPLKNININKNTNNNTNTNVNTNTNTNSISTLDSDSDGLPDTKEAQLKTNPRLSDTDKDGLFDGEEYKIYKTDPLNPDTDGDGYADGDEIKAGYNPNGPGKLEVPLIKNIVN